MFFSAAILLKCKNGFWLHLFKCTSDCIRQPFSTQFSLGNLNISDSFKHVYYMLDSIFWYYRRDDMFFDFSVGEQIRQKKERKGVDPIKEMVWSSYFRVHGSFHYLGCINEAIIVHLSAA